MFSNLLMVEAYPRAVPNTGAEPAVLLHSLASLTRTSNLWLARYRDYSKDMVLDFHSEFKGTIS